MTRLGLAIVAILSTGSLGPAAAAEQNDFPAYDMAKTCRTQADYAFAATLGEADRDQEYAACQAKEVDRKTLAQAAWPSASAAAKADCLGLADGKYAYLALCLENARPRAAR